MTPATKAPISIENPKKANKAAITKHQQIENKNKSSWDLAIFLVILGKMKYPIKNKTTIKPLPPNNPLIAKKPRLIPLDVEEINIKTAIATKSWIIKIPIEIFP